MQCRSVFVVVALLSAVSLLSCDNPVIEGRSTTAQPALSIGLDAYLEPFDTLHLSASCDDTVRACSWLFPDSQMFVASSSIDTFYVAPRRVFSGKEIVCRAVVGDVPGGGDTLVDTLVVAVGHRLEYSHDYWVEGLDDSLVFFPSYEVSDDGATFGLTTVRTGTKVFFDRPVFVVVTPPDPDTLYRCIMGVEGDFQRQDTMDIWVSSVPHDPGMRIVKPNGSEVYRVGDTLEIVVWPVAANATLAIVRDDTIDVAIPGMEARNIMPLLTNRFSFAVPDSFPVRTSGGQFFKIDAVSNHYKVRFASYFVPDRYVLSADYFSIVAAP